MSKRVFGRLCACLLVMALALGMFMPASVSSQTSSGIASPNAILDSQVIYPAGQTAAKFGDKVIIEVTSTQKGGSGSCDATLIGGSAAASLYDDGDYVVHRDRHANDGVFTNTFAVKCKGGYKRVPFTIGADSGSVSVGVDMNPPNVTNVKVIYPVGQSSVKNGDQVRIIAKISDKLVRKPVDVVMALDNSGSMAGAPITALVNAAMGFVDVLEPKDRVAIYCFGGDTTTPTPRLLLDWTYMDAAGKTTAKTQINTLLGDTSYNTPIWDTIYDSVKKAKTNKPGNVPVVVAMTDGANNVNTYGVNPWANWQDPPGPPGLANISMDVYTIGLGSIGTSTENILKNIAWTSHGPGMFFKSPTPAELDGIYQTIVGMILGGAPEGILWANFNATALGGVAFEPMFDDGMHNDGSANDEWFSSAPITVRNMTTGSWNINVTAYDVAWNTGTNYTFINIDNTPPTVTDIETVYEGSTPARDGDVVYFTAKVQDTGAYFTAKHIGADGVHGIAELGVTVDASRIGGDSAVAMRDDGKGNDATKGDGIYTSEKIAVRTNNATGVFTVAVTALDNAHNSFTQFGEISVDNDMIPPQISLLSPAKNEWLTGTYTFRVVVNDNTPTKNVIIEIKTLPKVSMAFDSASGEYQYVLDTKALPDGDYTVKAVVTDIYDRTAATPEVSFRVDNSIPTISFVKPTLEGIIIEKTYQIQVTANDSYSLDKVAYRIDNGPWIDFKKSGASYTADWDTKKDSDGNHTIGIMASDPFGNKVEQSICVRVDNNAPILVPVEMPPVVSDTKTIATKGVIPIVVEASDAVELKTVTIKLNNGTEMDMPNAAGSSAAAGSGKKTKSYGYTIDSNLFPSEQDIVITVTAYDMLDHATSVQRAIFVDRTAPTIADGSQLNTIIISRSRSILITVKDMGVGVEGVQISIDGGQWIDMVKSPNVTYGWVYEWKTGIKDNGVHRISVRAQDKLGNEAYAEFGARVQNETWNHIIFIIFVLATIIILLPPLVLRWNSQRAKNQKMPKTPKGLKPADTQSPMQPQQKQSPQPTVPSGQPAAQISGQTVQPTKTAAPTSPQSAIPAPAPQPASTTPAAAGAPQQPAQPTSSGVYETQKPLEKKKKGFFR